MDPLRLRLDFPHRLRDYKRRRASSSLSPESVTREGTTQSRKRISDSLSPCFYSWCCKGAQVVERENMVEVMRAGRCQKHRRRRTHASRASQRYQAVPCCRVRRREHLLVMKPRDEVHVCAKENPLTRLSRATSWDLASQQAQSPLLWPSYDREGSPEWSRHSYLATQSSCSRKAERR